LFLQTLIVLSQNYFIHQLKYSKDFTCKFVSLSFKIKAGINIISGREGKRNAGRDSLEIKDP
jgi:hypothetical protein